MGSYTGKSAQAAMQKIKRVCGSALEQTARWGSELGRQAGCWLGAWLTERTGRVDVRHREIQDEDSSAADRDGDRQ